MAKIIKETYLKENGNLVQYPLGADVKNVVITEIDANGNEVIKNTLDKELKAIKQDTSSAAYPSYSVENIETEPLQTLTKGESISASMRKLYKVVSRFIKHLKNETIGENHIPAGGQKGDILLWSSDGQAKWGPDEEMTYSNFTGATETTSGKAGLVPAPASGEQDTFLKADGSWGTPPGASYKGGIGINVSQDNKINLKAVDITNTSGTDSQGTEIVLPYLIFDEYGRAKNVGTRKHVMPESSFVGGVLTKDLFFGSEDSEYKITKGGAATFSSLKLNSNEAEWRGITITNSLRSSSLGLASNGEFWFKANSSDSSPSYKNDKNGVHIFSNKIILNSLKNSDEGKPIKVVVADADGSLTTSSVNTSELFQLKNVTSNIQSQLNAKVNINGNSNVKITKKDANWATIEFVNSKNSGSVLGLNESGEFGCFLRPTSAWVKFPTTSGTLALDTLSNGTGTAGLIKTSSTVTSNSGYTACPVIKGVPYYKNTTYSVATTSANGLMSSTMVSNFSKGYLSAGSTDVTLTADDTVKQLQTLTLTPGLWIVIGGARVKFGSNHPYVAASLGIHTSVELNPYPPGYARAIPSSTHHFAAGSILTLNCQMVYNVTENTKIYLVGKVNQDGGGGNEESVMRARLIAVKIPYV